MQFEFLQTALKQKISRAVVLIAAVSLVGAGSATAQDGFNDGQNLDAEFTAGAQLSPNEVASLLNRIDRLENTVSALMSGSAGASAGAGAGFEGGFADTGDEPAVVRLSIRVDNLEHQIRQMTGQIENLNYQVQQMAVSLDRFMKDTDFRLRSIEQRTGGLLPPGPGNGSGAGNGTGPIPTIPSDPDQGAGNGGGQTPNQPNQPRQPTQPAPGSGPDNSGGDGRASGPITLPIGSPQEQYRFAFSLLRDKDYDGAEQAFTAFLKEHPNDALAGNAQYWLGETFYVRRDYQTAATAFLKVYQDYPGGSKAADAMLKLGLSLSALGYKDQACQTFGELTRSFPNGSAKILNKVGREQSRLGCSG